jgi:hypothetical protein
MRSRKSTNWFFLILLLIPVTLAAKDPTDTDDFSAYVEQIRKWGMTEQARSSISVIASIEAGITLLSFEKEDSSGVFWPRYMSASCPKPDMSETELQELRDELEAKIAPLREKMGSVADTNNSGFVTTEEGVEFRAIVEFGYRASHVVNEEGHDIERICRGLGMNERQVRERAKQYKELLVKVRAAGLNLPDCDI